MNRQQRRAAARDPRTREQLRRQAMGPLAPQTLLIGEPGPSRVLEVSLFFRNDRNDNTRSSQGFALHIGAGEADDLWLDIEGAAACAQGNLDRYAAAGYSLSAVLDMLEGILIEMSPRIRPGIKPSRCDAGTALTLLLALRSFGRADDNDEFNGIVLMSTGRELRTLPTLQWHGVTTAGGTA